MASARRLRRAAIAAAIACTALLLVSGCAGAGAEEEPSPTKTESETPTPAAQTYPMPDLGPSPPPVPLTAEQTEQLRLQWRDDAWNTVQFRFPNAVRPDVPFKGYVAEVSRIEVISACYKSVGLLLDYGKNSSGKIVGVGTETKTEAEAVSAYACQAAHPVKPTPPPSPEQLGYIYDYLVEFLAPCYAANGIPNPPPPSRDDFIAKWPNQGWYPTSGNAPPDAVKDDALDAACPPTP
jgi:hypothetical protein